MESYVKLCIFLILVVVEIIMTIVAVVKGLYKRKVTLKLSRTEQEIDMSNYMIDECSTVETFSKFLKQSMSKQELSEYKRNTVLKNMKMYAKANGYTWYNEGVWGDTLTNYISRANTASGKHVTTK